MAAEDLTRALKVPGRLAIGGSFDFSAAYPHAGTALGTVLNVVARHKESYSPVKIEDFGVSVEIVDFVEAGERLALHFALRGHDPAAIGAVFRNTITGATSGEPGINHPGPRKEGALRSTARAVGLVFSPIDPLHPAVYLPQAIPFMEAEREILHHRSEERVLLAAFVATRISAVDGAAYQIRLLEDLTAINS